MLEPSTRKEKEQIRKKGLLNEDGDIATPFRRLKLVLDYWCSLWFWPIQKSRELPERSSWWLEIGAILEGNVVEVEIQSSMDLDQPQSTLPPQEEMETTKVGEGNPFAPDFNPRFGAIPTQPRYST